MTSDTVKRVLWTFVMAFVAAVLALAPGVLAAPNLKEAKALAVSAVVAGIAAGLSAIKNVLFPPGHPAR